MGYHEGEHAPSTRSGVNRTEHRALRRAAGTRPPQHCLWTSSRVAAYIPTIGGEGASASERLARRYFALVEERDLEGLFELMHPEVEVILKSTRPGDMLRGREEVVAFAREQADQLVQTSIEVVRPLDDTRVIVEGRVRWLDENRVLRDDPVVWALEFREGLLRRSTPAQSVMEAKVILAARGNASGGR